MPHASPSVMLLWTILCVIEMVFLLVHLYLYDKFACLRWNSSARQPGAFKRIMSFTYLFSIPLVFVYALSMAIIKYQQGYVDLVPLGHGIIPKPDELWPNSAQRWILPSVLCFSIAWSFEIVSHLEELTFWLFLMHQGPSQRDWFSSIEFRSWVLGSLIAVAGMPTITTMLRADPHECEAWTFFAGGIGSLLITLWFLVVLWRFPAFLRRVKSEGADAEVVVRLHKFNELNRIRVAFRFMFTLPLLALAIDGILPGKKYLNTSPFWTDLLAMLGGIGCIVSSSITLLIFFPRSVAKEAGYTAKTISTASRITAPVDRPFSRSSTYADPPYHQDHLPKHKANSDGGSPEMVQPAPVYVGHHGGVGSGPAAWELDEVRYPGDIESNYVQRERRNHYLRMNSEPHLADEVHSASTKVHKPIRPPRPDTTVLHPLISNYHSPMDMMDHYIQNRNRQRPARI